MSLFISGASFGSSISSHNIGLSSPWKTTSLREKPTSSWGFGVLQWTGQAHPLNKDWKKTQEKIHYFKIVRDPRKKRNLKSFYIKIQAITNDCELGTSLLCNNTIGSMRTWEQFIHLRRNKCFIFSFYTKSLFICQNRIKPFLSWNVLRNNLLCSHHLKANGS